MPYLHDMINNYKATIKFKNNKTQSGEWKIELCTHVNFIYFKHTGETRTIYIWSDNEKSLIGNETDDIIKELFEYFLVNYQEQEQIMRRGSDFVFESVELLDYHLHEISLIRGKSCIKYPNWLENKKRNNKSAK